MGYVTVTEFVGGVSKTYHFECYDDFKDWENKVSGVVVSAPEINLDGDIWVTNSGEYPPKGVTTHDLINVRYKNGEFDTGRVGDFYGWNLEKKVYSGVSADSTDYDIICYRKLS